jgi:hypothetical protein
MCLVETLGDQPVMNVVSGSRPPEGLPDDTMAQQDTSHWLPWWDRGEAAWSPAPKRPRSRSPFAASQTCVWAPALEWT